MSAAVNMGNLTGDKAGSVPGQVIQLVREGIINRKGEIRYKSFSDKSLI